MARTRISKIAKDLNIAVSTAVEFLRKKNIEIDDNPNTRIEDNIVDLLIDEFDTDGARKAKKTAFLSNNKEKESSPERKQPEHVETVVAGPKVIGKVEIDSHGNVVKKPAPEVEKPAVAAAPAPAPAPVAAPAPVREPVKPAPAPVEQPKPAAPAPEAKPVAEVKAAPAAPEVKAAPVKPAEAPKAAEVRVKKEENVPVTPVIEKKVEEKKEEEIFTLGTPADAPKVNVIGKIDLSTLNQSTRPKKKSKEERRNERNQRAAATSAAPGAAQGSAERKKRRRIGKEKIDIEKVQPQGGGQGGRNGGPGPQNNAQGNRQQRDKGNNKAKRQQHVEINEEDVQKQVKETLARLTSKDKGQKKAAKWRKEKREAFANREREAAEMADMESRTLKLTEFVTANDLASMMDVPINQVIATCMNIGVMVSINQRLDAETINIVAEEFGFKTEYVSAEVVEAIQQVEDTEDDLMSRPPIVTVMGHVDHGKTSLLDYIRSANVIAGEAGGITQHIGAYNVKLKDGRHITFLDTPGHEAFTAMRARGAKVTDLCIIIVAADDNVMPQTVEAINHASAAGVPIVFAINKIDKPTANPDKIKEELAGMNYLVEEWGGKYQSQDISAKKGIGVEELMEKVLLEAEMLELRANPNRNAVGSIIESSLDKGRGYVATVLVQNGTLRIGDIILAGTHFGKIKAMFNERNQRITEAGPAEPALILGLNGAPTAGDTFNVLETEQEAREIANKREQLQRELGLRTKKILTLEDIGRRRAIGNFQELNIIVKGDVDGSIEALSDSLIKLSTDEIQVNVLHKAVGEISESDVTLAAASDAIIIGFQVRPSQAARRAAEREGVEVRLYSVIYQAIEEVKDAMAGMLAPEIKEEITGTAEVMETYHISKVGTIAGALVREGRIKRGCKLRLIRDGIVRYTGDLGSLKRFKDDVKEVVSGYDCGISIAGYNDIKVGDLIEGFIEVEVNRSL
ncbi:MAG: translation initiation factor IF-2 [Muribaculaceae bacterium]|nr:translation initiation factor IF-2 [Muribaculaceae bacterium]